MNVSFLFISLLSLASHFEWFQSRPYNFGDIKDLVYFKFLILWQAQLLGILGIGADSLKSYLKTFTLTH